MPIFQAQFDHLAFWDAEQDKWVLFKADCEFELLPESWGGTGTFRMTTDLADFPVDKLKGYIHLMPLRVVKLYAYASRLRGHLVPIEVVQDEEGTVGTWQMTDAYSGAFAFECKAAMGDPEIVEEFGIIPDETDYDRILDELNKFDIELNLRETPLAAG